MSEPDSEPEPPGGSPPVARARRLHLEDDPGNAPPPPGIPWGPPIGSPAGLSGRLNRICLFLAVATFGCLLWRVRLSPERGTDGLIYHLTLAGHWLHAGYLADVDLPFHDGAAQHSPMLSQTVNWLLMKLTGDANLVWLVQPALLLAVLWVFFRTARLAGLPRGPAAGLTALLAVFRPFVNSCLMPNNDMYAVLGFALLALGIMEVRRRPGPALVVGAAGGALMIGTKVVGAVHAAVALPLLAGLYVLRARSDPGTRPGERLRRDWPYLAGSGALLAAGGAFLLRNWVLHGNPLYPAIIRAAGVEVFPGLYDYSVLSAGWPSGKVLTAVLFNSTQDFAPKWRFSIALWAGLLLNLALLASPRGRSRSRWPALAAGVVFPMLAGLIYFKTVPFREHQRLFFPVYYALFVGLAAALAALSRTRRPLLARAAAWVPPALAILALTAMKAWLVPGTIVLGVPAAALALAGRPSRRQARWCRLVAAGLLGIAALGGPLWYPAYRAAREARRARVYSVGRDYGGESRCWAKLDAIGAERGPLTVAYSGTPHVFPLFGPRLANRPVYVPISADDRPRPVKLYHGQGVHLHLNAARRARMDEEFWIRGLRERGVDVLVLVEKPGLAGGCAKELAVIARRPELFREIFADSGAHLVQVTSR